MSKSKLNRALLEPDKLQQLLSKMKSSFWGVPESTITKGESRWDHSFLGKTLGKWLIEYLEASESEITEVGNALLESGNMRALNGKNRGIFQCDDDIVYCFSDVTTAAAAAASDNNSDGGGANNVNAAQVPTTPIRKSGGLSSSSSSSSSNNKDASSPESSPGPKKLTERVQKKNPPVRKMSKLFRRPRSMTAASLGRSSRRDSTSRLTNSVQDLFKDGAQGGAGASPAADKRRVSPREEDIRRRPKSLSMNTNFSEGEEEIIRRASEAAISGGSQGGSSESPKSSPQPSARGADMDVVLSQTVSDMDIILLQMENDSLKEKNVHLEAQLKEKKAEIKKLEFSAGTKAADAREKRIAELIRRNGELEVENSLLKEKSVVQSAAEKQLRELEERVQELKGKLALAQVHRYESASLVLRRADEREVRVHGVERSKFAQLITLLEPKDDLLSAVRESPNYRPLFGEPVPGSVEARAGSKSPRKSALSPRPVGGGDADGKGDDMEGVVLGADKSLVSASVDGLIRYLVFMSSGTTDMHVVFLTYRSFLPPVALLHRFLRMYAASRERKVWLRLVSILSTWQKSYPEDWLDVPQLGVVLEKFLSDIVTPTLSGGVATKLRKAMRPSALSARVTASCRVASDSHKAEPVDPAATYTSMTLMNLSAVALAQQLIAVDYAMFSLVRTEDCFQQTWGQANVATSNLTLFTQWFNDMSAYLSWRVMQEADVNDRAQIVTKLVQVAAYCRDVNALHTMMGVMGALGSTALYRLRKTWDAVPKATLAEYESLNTLISPDKNFGALRSRTETASLPMIPYMGTLMGDLLFIHQGNETLVDGLLNFSKLRQITNVVRRLRHAQSLSYAFTRAPNVTQALQKLDSYKTEDEAFKRSLALEPRGQ